MLNEIKLESQIISLEAASGTAGLFSAIDRLPSFVNMVRNQFVKATEVDPSEPVPASYSKLAKQLAGARYTDMMPLRVHIPPGLSCTYLEYLNSLEHAEKAVLTIPTEVIRPFSVWIARLMSNPGEMASQRNMTEVNNLKLPDYDKLRDQIMGNIDGGSKQTESTYGKMVTRNADWGQIEQKLEDLNHHMVGSERKQIMQSVTDLADNINTLVERAKEDPEEYQFTEQSLSLFAKTCYQVAQILELYSVYCYQLRLLTVAIEDTQTYLEKIVSPMLKRA